VSEVNSVNGKAGTVVLAATDVEAIPESEVGQPDGVATLNVSGELPEAQLPSSVASGSAVGGAYNGLLWNHTSEKWEAANLASEPTTAEATVYVSKSGDDSNSGLTWGNAFATVKAAIAYIKALPEARGAIHIGAGYGTHAFVEPPLSRPSNCSVYGLGPFVTEIKLEAGATGNVLADTTWGKNEVGQGGVVENLTLNGNAAEQTMTCPQALVKSSTAISSSGVTLPTTSTTGFTSTGELWVGETRCAYTGKEAEAFTGVTIVSGFASFTASVEMVVVPFGSVGHGLAVQSSRFRRRNVVTKECVGSGFCIGAASTTLYSYECLQMNCRDERNGRYDMEILPYASDGMSVGWVGYASKLGSLWVGAVDWQFTNTHPTGGLKYGEAQLPRALITFALGQQQFRNLFLDSAPYDSIRLNNLAYGKNVNEITIDGELFKPSLASAAAGMGIQMYGGDGSLTAYRLDFRLRCHGRVYSAYAREPLSFLVGAQNLEAPPGGKVQVLSALNFSPLGSAAGGTITVSGSGTLAYTGTTSFGSTLAEAAESGATTLTLLSTSSLAASGIVTIFPSSSSELAVAALRVSYGKIVGNELREVTGVSDALPAESGVAQHFLTGVTGGTGAAVADGTRLTQPGRMISNVEGFGHFICQENSSAPGTTYNMLRTTGSVNKQLNPFIGIVKIAVGATKGKVAHGFGSAPQKYWGSPATSPQQLWWVTVTSTYIEVTLASAAAATEPEFQVVAWESIA
jgi:hypothetical protein